jgi:spore coat polysaccharide biosynthesis protein SpsF
MNKKNLRVLIIVQVRMGATRFPGKPMKQVKGKPLLNYLIERVIAAKLADQVIIATTTEKQDQEIVQLCDKAQISLFTGSEHDVLDRYYQAAKEFKADAIVRITGDCPLIDPQVIDEVIEYYLNHFPQFDYVSNMLKPSYPRGMDVEIFSFQTLAKANKEASAPEEREHVTLYIYEHPEQFSLGNVEYKENLFHYRWTVDTEEDFKLVSLLLSALSEKKPHYTLEDLSELMKQHPDWLLINSHIKQKPVRS